MAASPVSAETVWKSARYFWAAGKLFSPALDCDLAGALPSFSPDGYGLNPRRMIKDLGRLGRAVAGSLSSGDARSKLAGHFVNCCVK